jgi:hypothetical protein
VITDLRKIEDFVNGLTDVYTEVVAFNISILSTELADVIETIDIFISIASRVNATGEAPSSEEFDRINRLGVS